VGGQASDKFTHRYFAVFVRIETVYEKLNVVCAGVVYQAELLEDFAYLQC
jgi:hypothetical protein